MLKKGIKVTKKDELHYIIDNQNKPVKFKPWLGDSFSFLYDSIMKNSIFPKKFGGDINLHYKILSNELEGVHDKRVLELAAGSGSAVNFLPNDNQYTGTDISSGLLKKAVKKLRSAGFKNAEFYIASTDDLPFDDNLFDVVLCILSLNFFSDQKKALVEIKRVAAPEALFVCTVPVPERNKMKSAIRGTLYSEKQLEELCKEHGLNYETIPAENGALLYFKAVVQ